ncbi:MAG: hypothetical protein KDB23_09970 [Planctomycetales bacterium]|nr:hypothetical protein [Planctomycetales bacterium]
MSTNNNLSATPQPTRSPKSRRNAMLITIFFAAIVLPISMYGFVSKFRELIHTFQSEGTEGAFAVTPMVNYLCSSMGFFFMLMWAVYNGMFRDIEAPKETMLDQERQLDRGMLR